MKTRGGWLTILTTKTPRHEEQLAKCHQHTQGGCKDGFVPSCLCGEAPSKTHRRSELTSVRSSSVRSRASAVYFRKPPVFKLSRPHLNRDCTPLTSGPRQLAGLPTLEAGRMCKNSRALWAARLPFIEDGSTSVETFLNLFTDRELGTELRNRIYENYGYLKAISAII